MDKGKIENPLVDNLNKPKPVERIAKYTMIALLMSGISGAVLSRIVCKQEKKPKEVPQLKVCTPEENLKVKEVLNKGRRTTRNNVKFVIKEIDQILAQKLDCGWEPVMNLRKKLSSRLQP